MWRFRFFPSFLFLAHVFQAAKEDDESISTAAIDAAAAHAKFKSKKLDASSVGQQLVNHHRSPTDFSDGIGKSTGTLGYFNLAEYETVCLVKMCAL